MVHDVAFLVGELAERHVGAHAHRAAHVLHEIPHERAPWGDCSLVDGLRLVGHERGEVHFAHDAGAGAGGACAGRVEGEGFGAGPVERLAAYGASDGQFGGHVERGFVACAAVRAHVRAAAREQEPQAVEQFAHRAERGAHAGDGGALVEGERSGHVAHVVDPRARRLGETPARVRGQRLQVSARALRIEHAQRERAFARSGDACHTGERVQRHVHVDALEIMHMRAAHFDRGRHVTLPLADAVFRPFFRPLQIMLIRHAAHCRCCAPRSRRTQVHAVCAWISYDAYAGRS